MGGRHRQSVVSSDHQPGRRRQECGQHPVDVEIGNGVKGARREDALPYLVRDVPADEQGSRELDDTGDDDRLLQGQGFGADGRAHRIRHVVGADTPGHEKAEDDRQGDEPTAVRYRVPRSLC